MAVGQRRDILVSSFKEPIIALEVVGEIGTRGYSEAYRMPLASCFKRCRADAFVIKKFGVNKTELKPGTASSKFHFYTR
ncbi:MAG: hypothetical protein CMM76_13095 [Rhodospirillaceae bacterium]|nr:hypothetical protein [Rhodospirillaceae bacterium]